MEYRKNFYYVLRELEDSILGKTSKKEDYVFSRFTKEGLLRVIDFVRSGKWTKSRNIKFICRNYHLRHKELHALWNRTNDVEKSLVTIRRQHSSSASQIGDFLGGVSYVREIFYAENEQEIIKLLELIDTFKYGDTGVLDMFDCAFLDGILGDCSGSKIFDISDCEKELNFLSVILRENMKRMSSGLSSDKLSYILRILDKPLFNGLSVNFDKKECLMSVYSRISKINLSNYSESQTSSFGDQIMKDDGKVTEIKDESVITRDIEFNNEAILEVGDVYLPSVLLEIMEELGISKDGDFSEDVDLNEMKSKKVIATLARYSVVLMRNDLEGLDTDTLSVLYRDLVTNSESLLRMLSDYQERLLKSDYISGSPSMLVSYIDSTLLE